MIMHFIDTLLLLVLLSDEHSSVFSSFYISKIFPLLLWCCKYAFRLWN